MPPITDNRHLTLPDLTSSGYTITSAVGEGGTSSVYQAQHPVHGTVAIKVLKSRLRQDRTAITRFLREAEYGSRVRHPNVVKTIEINEREHFLSIEWAKGELLEKYAKKNSPLPSKEVGEIITQIAAGVQAAHNAQIVHRDLKPDNVMYDPESGKVKLLDFGIAADTNISADERLTRVGFFVGTLMYVAPESLSGELVTPAADQYSLATITYFLLTGAHPYTAKVPREMFTQLLTQPPISLNQAKEGLKFNTAVEEVIMKGLSKEPSDRYSSVSEFAEKLQNALTLPPEKEKAKPKKFWNILRGTR